ncbi:hypothetical protein ABZ897_45095 [Nonomuraea sp. NPDC046802]|uniref:hypothetical protein n=1 Tax=Nonomuraea sp. NPDC046802 TaxID=3154919 RepID=UPI0033D934C5
MNSPDVCATTVALNDDESSRLAQVPDGAHELTDTLQCELQAGHPGSHMALGQAGLEVAWWLRWSTTERALITVDDETGYCEATGRPVDSDPSDHDDWLCQLPAEHFGAHSWQMSAVGRVPSEANQQKLIDMAYELMERRR